MTREYWWEDWMNDGACLKVHEPEMMCDPSRVAEAREVCGRCTQNAPCLDWAIRTGQEWCVHAGLRFTHEIKRLLASPSKAGAIMAHIKLLKDIPAYGINGDDVDIPFFLAEQFVAAGYAEALDGKPLAPTSPDTTSDDDAELERLLAEEEALQAEYDAKAKDNTPVVADELPTDTKPAA